METKDVIAALRTRRGLSQEQLAERLYVTRQAVSRCSLRRNGGAFCFARA